MRELAFETQRYSGAQLANLVNIAASFVGRDGRDVIAQADLLYVRTTLLKLHFGCSAALEHHKARRRLDEVLKMHISV